MEPVKELAVAARLCPRGRRITPSVSLNGTPVSSRATPAGPAAGTLSLRDLFVSFFRAGLAFGGGLGIMAALEEELVHKRGVVSRTDYLATYSLARFVPSGTMTAMAVAYGHRFGGWIGSAVAMAALVLPSTVLTILLTMAYGALRGGPTLELLAVTVVPAALAFIVASTLKFGKQVFRPGPELVIAAAAFGAMLYGNVHPSLVLLGGGLAGFILCRRENGTERRPEGPEAAARARNQSPTDSPNAQDREAI